MYIMNKSNNLKSMFLTSFCSSQNCSERLSSRTDPAQDMQDPLCIPERYDQVNK